MPVNKKVKTCMIGILVALIMTMILISVYSAILSYTNVSEKWEDIVIILITISSIFIGSIVTGKTNKTKGMLNGGIVGFVYLIILYLLSSTMSNNFQIGIQGLILVIICIALGIIGGIIGVNI